MTDIAHVDDFDSDSDVVVNDGGADEFLAGLKALLGLGGPGAAADDFNAFPDKDDDEVRKIAVVGKAMVWQAVGELVRREAFVKSAIERGIEVPEGANDPVLIEQGLDGAMTEVLAFGFLSGKFSSEHELLQNIIDNGGVLTPPTSSSADTEHDGATDTSAQEEVTAQ